MDNNHEARNAMEESNQAGTRPAKGDGQPAPKPKNEVVSAFQVSNVAKGFMRNRFFALLVDFVVVYVLCLLAQSLFGKPAFMEYMEMGTLVEGITDATHPDVLARARLYQEAFIISLTITAAYEALMLCFFRATIGKLIFRMRVVDNRDGRNFFLSRLLLVARSLVRIASMYLLSALPFIFMCLTAFGNPDRRSGFDMFSGTKVVDIRKEKT